jgi:hypothetical protein
MIPENKVQPKMLDLSLIDPNKDKMETILNSDASLTITEIIQNILSGYIPFSIQLTESETQFMKYLLEKQPFVITEIQTKILSIIRDNKIDTADIPYIIQLVKQLYILCHTNKTKILNTSLTVNTYSYEKPKITEIISRLIKFIIRVILLKKIRTIAYTKVDEWQIDQDATDALLINIDSLIDISLELIMVSKQIKWNRFFSCWK